MAEITNEEVRDAFITGLVALAAGIAFLWWLADRMGKQDAAKRYMVDEEANLDELDGFARVRDGRDDVWP